MSQTLIEMMAERPELYDMFWKIGNNLASAKSMPSHLRGDPHLCALIAMKAYKWKIEPMDLALKTYSISGGPIQYEAQAINAAINLTAPLVGGVHYKPVGDWSKIVGKVKQVNGKNGKPFFVKNWDRNDVQGLGIVVTAMLDGWPEPQSISHMLSQVTTFNSGNWSNDPYQQMCYLGLRKFVRRYCPEVILGAYSVDEPTGSDANLLVSGDGEPADPQSGPEEAKKPTQAEALLEQIKGDVSQVTGNQGLVKK